MHASWRCSGIIPLKFHKCAAVNKLLWPSCLSANAGHVWIDLCKQPAASDIHTQMFLARSHCTLLKPLQKTSESPRRVLTACTATTWEPCLAAWSRSSSSATMRWARHTCNLKMPENNIIIGVTPLAENLQVEIDQLWCNNINNSYQDLLVAGVS